MNLGATNASSTWSTALKHLKMGFGEPFGFLGDYPQRACRAR